MYLVEKTFRDKETKKLHEKGTIYVSDNETRIKELKKGGFLGIELMIKEKIQALEENLDSEKKQKDQSKDKNSKTKDDK